jgi:aspartate/methionine/tyrosine aminotransferase
MFVWARIPDRYADCHALSDEVLRDAAVFITPGGIFGSAGDRFVRISLCSPAERIGQALQRIKGIGKNGTA